MITATALALGLLLPASIGVGISASPVCMDVTLSPGHTWSLGTVTVANTGDSQEAISVAAGAPAGQAGRALPASWVHVSYPRDLWFFQRNSVPVDAGKTASVPLSVAIPAGTRPGRYVANLIAETGPGAKSAAAGGIAQFSAAAETPLVVNVGPHAGQPASCAVHPAPVPSISGPPTAGPSQDTAAPAHAQASPASDSARMPTHLPSDWAGWLVVIVVGIALLRGLLKLLRIL
jgi:hypothetical protein